MRCPKCGEENLIGAVYCETCGCNLKEMQPVGVMHLAPAPPPTPVYDTAAPAAPAPYAAPAPAAPAPYAAPAPAAPAPYAAPAPAAPAPYAAPAPAAPAPRPGSVQTAHSYALLEAAGGFKFYIETERIMLGRGPAQSGQGTKLDLGDLSGGATVSKKHASLMRDAAGIFIEDIGSGNGTFVNGDKLLTGVQRQLSNGDSIRLGAVVLTLRILSK